MSRDITTCPRRDSYQMQGGLNPRWALRELQWVLENTRDADPRHLVAEELARLAPEYPKESVLNLRLLVETRTKQWEIYGIRDEARIILDAALSSEDANNQRDRDSAGTRARS